MLLLWGAGAAAQTHQPDSVMVGLSTADSEGWHWGTLYWNRTMDTPASCTDLELFTVHYDWQDRVVCLNPFDFSGVIPQLQISSGQFVAAPIVFRTRANTATLTFKDHEATVAWDSYDWSCRANSGGFFVEGTETAIRNWTSTVWGQSDMNVGLLSVSADGPVWTVYDPNEAPALAAHAIFLYLPLSFDEGSEIPSEEREREKWPTALDDLRVPASGQVFDILGRRVDRLTAGQIYIINGKKYIAK